MLDDRKLPTLLQRGAAVSVAAPPTAFYERLGFVPIEVFPTLWGTANPCLLMIRPVVPLTPRDC